MYCGKCGRESLPGDVYCRGCGELLPQSPQPAREDPVRYTEQEYPDERRKRNGLLPVLLGGAIALCLAAGAGVAAWRLNVPDKVMSLISQKAGEDSQAASGDGEDIQLSSLIEIQDLEVSREDDTYTAQAEVVMPDLSQCLLDISDEVDIEGLSLEEAEELLSQEFLKYAQSEDASEITLDIQVDLLGEARRKVSSLEYLMENPVTDEEDYEFTDSEIEELVKLEAIRRSFADYMEYVYENLDLDDNGIIPEYYLNTDD